jgi:2-haloacid dehalogenase
VAQAELAMDQLDFKQWVGDILDAGGDIAVSLEGIKAESTERHRLLTTYMSNIALAHATPVLGTAAIIERLSAQGLRILGMTNAGVAAYEALEYQFPVIALMEDVFVSAREKIMKPQAEAYLLLLSRNNVLPEQCIFVDDVPRNVAGAEAVGIASILFVNSSQLESDLTAKGVLSKQVLK